MFLVKLLIVLLFPLTLLAEITELSLTADQVRQQLSCYEEDFQTLELITAQKTYLMELPYFFSTPIINSNVVCRKFISELPNYLQKNKLNLVLKLTELKANAGHYQIQNTDLVRHCSDLKYCWRDIFDYFNNNSTVNDCYPKPSLTSLWKKWKPKLKTTTVTPIKKVTIEFFPFKPFSEKVLEYQESQDTYTSTMSLGTGTLKQYAKQFQNSNKRLFLMLDAGLVFSTGQTALLTNNFSSYSQLFAIPMTSGQAFDSIHHQKFIFGNDPTRSTLSSMNLTTPERTNYLDAIYNFAETEVRTELKEIFLSSVKKQCQTKEDFNCLTNFSSIQEREQRKLKKILVRSCEELAKELLLDIPIKHFLEPKSADLDYVTSNLIKQAKKEIIIISHKFKLERLYQDLKTAQANGIKVYLYVTSPPSFATSGDKMTYVTSSRQNHRQVPDPHMKVMLIDREELWFGTGNFSHNAFHQANELYSKTLDQTAIQKILEIAAVLHAGFSKEITNYHQIKPPEENWIYLGTESSIKFDNLLEPISEQVWLKYYRKILKPTKDILKICNLDHLLIIPKNEFENCVESQNLE